MDKDRSHVTERILNITLEIIYLLIGEDYTVVNKSHRVIPSSGHHTSGVWSRTQSPIMEPPPHSLIHERNNDQKILELTNKIIQLLTGEVPIRCQDVTVYFSMEEWEYLEGHKDLYKDVMMENHTSVLTQISLQVEFPAAESAPIQRVFRMDKDRNHMTERILNLTLEIIYLLTGEDYTVMKKSGNRETPSISPRVSGGRSRTQSPIMEPPPHSLIPERNNEQKILELTNKIIQLLTGEVPIRCQDVTVYFSMEEWEYLEEHKDLYKDVMMENHRPLTSLDGSSNRNTPERCPSPLYSQDSTEEDIKPFMNHSEEGSLKIVVVDINPEVEDAEAMYMKIKEEEIATEISTYYQAKDPGIPDCPQGVASIAPNTYSDLSSDSFDYGKYFHPNSGPAADEQLCSERRHVCPVCGLSFAFNSRLVIHQRIHTGEKPFTCSECGKGFIRNSDLIKHKKTHTGHKPFACSECGKCFVSSTYFLNHQRLHAGEKLFECSECGRSFTTSAHLVSHQRSHSGEKPFSCSVCGKCFTTSRYLLSHQRLHTGESTFSCSECGKCFINNSHLVVHRKIHSEEKAFSCADCGKRFRRNSHLVIHQQIHSGEKPFVCSQCGKCFLRHSGLLAHERTHTGEKPFLCSFCGKGFNQSGHLARHRRIHRKGLS